MPRQTPDGHTRWLVILLAAFGVIIAAACGAISQPQGWAPPLIDGDALYITDADGHIYALDLTTRQVRWRYPIEGERDKGIDLQAIYGKPAIDGDVLYVGGYDGWLYAIDVRTGELRWRYDTGSPIVGGPLAEEGRVYVGSSDGCLYGLSVTPQGPVTAWEPFCTEGSVWSQPVKIEDVIYITSMDGKMYGLDAETGQPRWERPFAAGGGIPTTPLVADGSLLVGALDRRLYAVDGATGEVAWSFRADNWFWSEPLAHEGMIFAGALDGVLYAFDPARPGGDTPVWTFTAESPIRSRPVVAADTVVVADRNGKVYGLDLATGRQKWRTDLRQSVLADLASMEDAVFVSLQDGSLTIINPVTGEPQDVPYRQ